MSTRKLVIISLLGFVIILGSMLPAFIRARTTPASNSCINNLRQIDGAKQQWALENSKNTNDVPTMAALRPYMGRGTEGQIPLCPQGGIYKAERVGVPPTCSIPSHTLPQ